MDKASQSVSLVFRILLALPVIGYGLRCAHEERLEELGWLVFTIALAVLLAVLIWGYAALISVLHGLVVLVSTLVLTAVAG